MPKPPEAASAPEPAGADRGGDERERGGAAAVPLEERKKRFAARTTKRLAELAQRIPEVDAKLKGLDEVLVRKWGEIKPDLDAKLAAAKKDFDAYLADPTDEAFGQARPKIRRALGSIEDALDAAEAIGAAAKRDAGAAPPAPKTADNAG